MSLTRSFASSVLFGLLLYLISWRDEIAPDLAKSHPDLVEKLAEKGDYEHAHVSALAKATEEFLGDSLVKAKRQVSRSG